MNLKPVRIFTLLCCLGCTVSGYSQPRADALVMTLEECLEYAKANSITLQQAQIQIEDRFADEMSAKGAFLPSVSASIGQGLNSNPLASDASGVYTGSYGVDLSMPIYNGGSNKASMKQSLINTEIASLYYEEQLNTLEVSITELFVQILYAMEQIEVNKLSLELSDRILERGYIYHEVGSINSSDLAQLESARADSEYDVAVAQTTLSNLNVRLKHLLEISQDIDIFAVAPILADDIIKSPLPSVAEVYAAALDIRPEIKSSVLAVSSAELDQAIARSGYLPTVSLTAGTGVSHNSSSSYTFSGQMRENFSTSVGAGVSVPIFSKLKNKSNVAKAKNAVASASLSLTDAEKTLYQTIETLRNTASNAQIEYAASDYKLTANKKSLELSTEQYNLKLKNIIELLTEQDDYRDAAQEFLISKYQFILNKALLEYYQTNTIKL